MTFSIFAILLLAFLLACLVGLVVLVIAVAGKHGGKIAAGLGAAVVLGLMLLCGGFFAMFVSVQRVETTARHDAMHSHAEIVYGETAKRARAEEMSTWQRMTSQSQAHPLIDEPSNVSETSQPVSTELSISPQPTTEQVTASTGRTIGQFAGAIYQEFRNQLKSGELDLDPSKIIPPGRPSWVEQEPHWGHDQTYYVSVSSGPYDRGMDCRRALDLEISKAIDQFAVELTGNEDAPALIADELTAMKETVAAESYQEELTPSFGVMQQWHSLLKFDPAIQDQIRQFWYAQQRISRVVYIGTGFLFLLGLMSIFYAGMSLTGKGSRVSPGLVSAGSVAALCGLIAAGVIFVRSFPML